MKRTLLFLTILLSYFGSQTCPGPLYLELQDHYVYLKNGPISTQQLADFIPVVNSDNNNVLMLDRVNSVHIYIKPAGSSEKTGVFFSYRIYAPESGKNSMSTDIQPYLDSLSGTLNIGDSIFIHTSFRTKETIQAEYWGTMIDNHYFYLDSKYELETDAMVHFVRNADNRLSNYPNPANQKFTLSVDLAEAREGRYMILNTYGIKVKEETFRDVSGTHTIDISGLASGNYMLYVLIEADVYIRKFVKVDGSV